MSQNQTLKDFIASAIAQKRWVYAVPKSSMDDWKDSFIFAFFGGDGTLNMDSVVNRLNRIQVKNPGIQVFSVPQENETLDEADFYSADKEVAKELEKVGFVMEGHLSNFQGGLCPWVPKEHQFYESFQEENEKLYEHSKKGVIDGLLTLTKKMNLIGEIKTRKNVFEGFLTKVFGTGRSTFAFCVLMSESRDSFKGLYDSLAEKVNMVRNEPGGLLLENAIRHFDEIRTNKTFYDSV